MFETWLRTVFGDSPSRRRDLGVRPAPRHEVEDLASRARSARGTGGRTASPARRGSVARRRATPGPKIASPAAAARIARSSSARWAPLSTYPRAPARTARHDRVVAAVHRQDDDRRHAALASTIRRVASIPSPPGIVDVHEDDVRLEAFGARDRLGPRGRLADDLEIAGGLEQRPEPGPERRVVVDDEDADGRGRASVTSRLPRSRPSSGASTAQTQTGDRQARLESGPAASAPLDPQTEPPSSVARLSIDSSPVPGATPDGSPWPSSTTSMTSCSPDVEPDRAGPGLGVADRVGQRLDGDPVRRDLDRRRQVREREPASPPR